MPFITDKGARCPEDPVYMPFEKERYEHILNPRELQHLSAMIAAKNMLITKLIEEVSVLKLAAKLEKRVKVVFCRDCTLTYATKITGAHKCKIWGHQVSPGGFCNRGRAPKLTKMQEEACKKQH